jgi:hypothetical protein
VAIGSESDRSATLRPGHVVQAQRIDVRIARQDRAFDVMGRIGELNRERLLPLIERVFEEFDRRGEVIRIERLDLDLGRFPQAEIAGGIERRLEAALREALRDALRDAMPIPSMPGASRPVAGEGTTVRSVGAALTDSFEHWLLRGTWPYGAGLGLGTGPAELMARLLVVEPEALVAMLRRRAGDETVPRRLVRQMPHALLERLLASLDPESAHWILGYMAETRAAHAAEPLVAQAPQEFARTLWFVVLRDALRRSGLRANRRAFVAKLVADIAAAAGLDPAGLLRALLAGLAAAPSAARGDASLLSILAEIGEKDSGAFGGGTRGLADGGGHAAEEARADDVASALAALEAVLAAGPAAGLSFAEAVGGAARRLQPGGATDEPVARGLLARLAAADAPALGRLLRRRAAAAADWTVSGLIETNGAEQAADLILPPHLAEAAAGLMRLSGCGAAERAALIAAATALPPSAPAAFAVAELVRRLASDRGIAEAALLSSLYADALAAGGEAGARLAPLLAEARDPAGRAQTAAVRRELAFDLLNAALTGGAASPPPHSVEAAMSSLAGVPADVIRREVGAARLEPRRAAVALSRLTPRALVRLIVLLAAGGGERSGVRAALAAAGGDPAFLATLAAELVAGTVPGAGRPANRRRAAWTAAEARALERLGSASSAADRAELVRALPSLARGDPAEPARRVTAAGAAGARHGGGVPPGPAGARGAAGATAHAAAREAQAAVVRALFFLVRRNPVELVRSLTSAEGLGATGGAVVPFASAGGSRAAARAARRAAADGARRLDVAGLGQFAAAASAAETAVLALLFDRMSDTERREAETLARLLSGPRARSSLSVELVLRTLLAAAVAAVARGGRKSFAALWRAEFAAAASPAEREALARIIPQGLAAGGEARRPPATMPERGSAAWLLALLDAPPEEARRELALLRSPGLRRRLARRLPRHLLARLLFAARPREARALLAAGDLARGVFAAQGRSLAPEQLWEALLAGAAAPPGGAVRRLVDRLVPPGAEAEALAAALLARARAVRQAPLAAALEELAAERAAAGRAPPPAPKRGPIDERSPFGRGEEAIAVGNAGLVIAAPYLPALFERLGLVERGSDGRTVWVDPEASGRGVHLLQYLADGRTDAPEPFLALNKILCGLDPSWPALPGIEPTQAERETCLSLLEAIVANWPMLRGSSVAALQETFLQREGRLVRAELGWKLEVERKTLDVLLDDLPWSFSTILSPWMNEPLTVAW